MKRPLSDKRPIGPVAQLGGTGQCMLRVKMTMRAVQLPTESIPSLKQSIKREASEVTSVDNISIVTAEGRFIEVGMDVLPRELTDEQEDKLSKAIGRAILDGGAIDPDLESYKYSVVSR